MWALSSGWGADGWRGVDAISEMLVVGVGGCVIGQLGFLFQYVVKHESLPPFVW